MTENIFLKWALWYREKMGFSVIPIKEFMEDGEVKKKPYIEWLQWQKEKPTSEQIKKWWLEHPKAMIGIITGVISGISVIDADTYKMTEDELRIYQEIFPIQNTPTAISPQGGEHFYFKYHAELPQKSDIHNKIDGRNNGGYIVAPPSSANGTGIYKWQKDKRLGDIPLMPVPNQYIKNILSYRGGFIRGGIPESNITNLTHITHIEEGVRDQELFHLANMMFKGGANEEEVIKYITLFGKYCCNPPFPEKEIITKVQSAEKRVHSKKRNIAEEVKQWVELTSGNFLLTNISHELTLLTSAEKQAATMALKRLCEQGIIEKVGNRRGSYRLVEKDIEKIDLKKTIIELKDKKFKGLDIRYPFGIERFFWTYPKSIIVIAGSKGAGKTAFALNLVKLNQGRHRIVYFNSEMGEDEFASRLMGFEEMEGDDWKFEPFIRSMNFQDVIEPNAINIIDFLEKEEEFWTIAKDIRNIWEKLKKGIAIICIQKDAGAVIGRGRDFSREKARLYLTLDYDSNKAINTLKIIDIKNWRDPAINPIGKFIKFKLHRGVRYSHQGAWEEEYE